VSVSSLRPQDSRVADLARMHRAAAAAAADPYMLIRHMIAASAGVWRECVEHASHSSTRTRATCPVMRTLACAQANVNSFFESDVRIITAIDYIDQAVGERDTFDNVLARYKVHWNVRTPHSFAAERSILLCRPCQRMTSSTFREDGEAANTTPTSDGGFRSGLRRAPTLVRTPNVQNE
jgi:hypothetical protein